MTFIKIYLTLSHSFYLIGQKVLACLSYTEGLAVMIFYLFDLLYSVQLAIPHIYLFGKDSTD
jgi:hypothetical protein